ncbi:MAG TPA: DPP IV N-terminal domain-containing protein [Bryobacteraceae bacterium]|nr:DPP IV N-terminal domain-containing protein [Bryobacteraceae bacterium]
MPSIEPQRDRRLDSWKEIAAYLGRDVRTVQRWEKEEGLPVHRHTHKKLGTVYGFQSEIDAWWESRRASLKSPQPLPKRSRRTWLAVGAAAAIVLGAGVVLVIRFITPEPAPVQFKAVPFTTYPGDELGATFSPDGNQVAFAWNGQNQDNYDIYLKAFDSETPYRLTTDPEAEMFPAWSPDGRRIAFVRSAAPWKLPAAIYVIPATGGPQTRVAQLSTVECFFRNESLSWSPDGKWLAFADGDSAEAQSGIHVLSVETGETRRLTLPPAGWGGDELPAFSPDGRSIAFARFRSLTRSDIYLVSLDGGMPRRLSFANQLIRGLVWTPDGKAIVFSSDGLWKVAVTGGSPERLQGTSDLADAPAISPQGGRLIFSRPVSNENIWRVGVQGSRLVGEPTRLIASTRDDTNPQYSPDGRRIIFDSNRSGNWELWVCNSDGSNPIPVSRAGWPSWSPDGKYIAFDDDVKGSSDIYVVSAEGGTPRAITHRGENAGPSWSADGWIYFQSNRSGSLEIWRTRPDGGEQVQVTRKGGTRPAVAPDGKFVYFAKGVPAEAIWRIPAEGGEETLFLDNADEADMGHWAPVKEGFYFVLRKERRKALAFLDFKTGGIAEVMQIEKPWDHSALSVSPDGRSILYPQFDEIGHDLMLVENFR